MLSSANSCFEGEFVIVWYDPQPDDNLHRTIRLHAIERHLHTFTDRSQCFIYLNTYASNSLCKIFFVVSGSAGNQVIPDIYSRPSIAAMYICCARPEFHLTWTQNYTKIRGVFIDKKELVDKLMTDISAYLASLTTVGMVPSMNDVNYHSSKLLASEHARFMWMRFFCAIMARLSSDKTLPLKNSLVAMCNSRYEHDQFEQERISEFERTYDASKAIWWYTRDSFLYRLMNRAFRSEDTNMLFEFRSVITDLQNQIAQLHKVQYANDSKRFTVYRGQGMSEEELQNIIDNREGFLSFNTFLSTTLSSNVASDYAGDAVARLIYERSVLFQIDLDTTIDSAQPFANIAEHSCMKTENEVLFSFGTIFRIDAVSELVTGGLWIVELSLTDAYDPNLDKLFAYYRRELEETPAYAILANLMRNASKENDRAELYCSQLFNNPSVDMGLVYYQAGLLYEDEVKDLAELHYLGAVRWFTESNNQNGLVQVYATQAEFYRNQQKFTRALAYNRRARKVEKQIIASERLQSLPNLHANLATIYSQMGKHSLALKLFKKAARRNRKHELPINHPNYAGSYVSIGDEYTSMQQYKWALKYYRKAFVIQERYLNKENTELGKSLINIAKIQVRLSNFTEAISSYQRAIFILSNSNQRDEEELIDNHRRLGRIYEEKSEFEKALDHYRIAFALPARRATSVYMDIAHACELSDDTHSAIQACKRGLREFRKLGKDILLDDSEIDVIIFLNDTLGRLYQKQKKYRRALTHFYNKLDIELIWSPHDRDRLGTTYYRLASCHFEAGQHHSALKFYCKLLRYASHLVGGSKRMLSMLLQICIDKQYYSEALRLLHKQLSLDTGHFSQAKIYASMAFIYQRMGCSHLARKLYEYALPILASMTECDGEIDFFSIKHTFQPIDHPSTKVNQASSRDVVSVTDLTEGIKHFTLTGNIE